MKLPSKVTPYKRSILHNFAFILDLLVEEPMTPAELYEKFKKERINNLSDFCDTLDCLFVLNKIELKEGVLTYVDRD